MKPILEVEGLGKRYKIGGKKQPYLSLRESLTSVFSRRYGQRKDTIWALKDINFKVYPGESLGIIGPNGAGKSTLLKILSRITPPTEGRIVARGRVASLLEVGTGFHPELTGRENIYLNGSILGLRRAEIKSKFDEIVDFSGVERFLDTPLKHYSSGMQLRLAFAVAAHLEPEILVIDEVLAVGDAEFQKKCLGKMEEVSRGGRTIIFVSHNMEAVETLCQKTILLQKGLITYNGNVTNAINSHLNRKHSNTAVFVGDKMTLIKKMKLINAFEVNSKLEFELEIEIPEDINFIVIAIRIKNRLMKPISMSLCELTVVKKTTDITLSTDQLNLIPGKYYIDVSISDKTLNKPLEKIENILEFSVRSENNMVLRRWNSNWGDIVLRMNINE